MTQEECGALAEEIREKIITTVAECGGHLSSNLGVVELTIALHRAFDFPYDQIVFDVGHQCYTHKLLSGRESRFSTLRREGGLSGFPKRSESEYDVYETGHAGTAISAALGLAKARDLKGEHYEVIALVGDGSFNNGLIYEALNSLKILNTRALIILNDNGMSISPTVGSTHEILTELKEGEKPNLLEDVRLFERFGLEYLGGYNGNNLKEAEEALALAKEKLKTHSVLLHFSTQKGHGHPFSENAPDRTHGVSPHADGVKTEYSAALGEELTSLAANNKKIVAVTAAMTDALGLRGFFDTYPDRAFDVGICEEHASVLSAAMAVGGMKPYYAIYSTFLQRAFDEIIHDICSQDLPVTFCVDRAGVTGADGETHQGVFDLSYLSFIPNLTVAIPKNIAQFREMLRASATYPHPLAIRYPRYGTEGTAEPVPFGRFEVLHRAQNGRVAILAAGERCLSLAAEAQNRAGTDVTLINACSLRPLDEELLRSLPEENVITLEDNVLIGGLGDAVRRFYAENGISKRVKSFGFADRFLPHGTPASLAKKYGLNAEEIAAWIRKYARG